MVSDERLIEDLQEFAEEFDDTPGSMDMRNFGPWSVDTYSRHFGSWNKALEKAGLEKNHEVNVSDERLINDLKEFADEIGEVPTKEDISGRNNLFSPTTYSRHFGSWNKALEKAGLEKNHEVNVSDERLINDLKEFADEIGEVPTCEKMWKDGPRSGRIYNRRFGSWNEALEKAGMEKNREVNVSDERLINDLKEFADEIGRTPTGMRMRNSGPWDVTTYVYRFGSWNEALEKAGMEKNREVNVSDERLINDLKEFADEIGKIPTVREMRKFGPYHPTTYEKRFDSWENALNSAGMEVERKGLKRLIGESERSYGKGWSEKRESALQRDGYECRICSADEMPCVHHIKPRRKFDNVSDSNTLGNLITLCPSCHGTFEGRWQDCNPDEFEERAKELYSQRA